MESGADSSDNRVTYTVAAGYDDSGEIVYIECNSPRKPLVCKSRPQTITQENATQKAEREELSRLADKAIAKLHEERVAQPYLYYPWPGSRDVEIIIPGAVSAPASLASSPKRSSLLQATSALPRSASQPSSPNKRDLREDVERLEEALPSLPALLQFCKEKLTESKTALLQTDKQAAQ